MVTTLPSSTSFTVNVPDELSAALVSDRFRVTTVSPTWPGNVVVVDSPEGIVITGASLLPVMTTVMVRVSAASFDALLSSSSVTV